MKTRSFLLLVLLVISAGCVTTTEFESLKNDVNFSKSDSFELKKDMAEIKNNLSAMNKEIAELKQVTTGPRKDESLAAFRENQALLSTQISDISRDIQLLRGRFDESKFYADKNLKDSSLERDLLRSQLTNLEKQIKEISSKILKIEEQLKEEAKARESQKAEAKKEEPPPPKTETKDSKKVYEDAIALFKEKKFKESRERLEAFTKEFPSDDLVGNAQFWIAETHYAEKNYEDAILAYENFLKKYPKNEKQPGAMLKQAYAFIEIGDRKTGKIILEKLVEKFPGTKEAELAGKKISDLSKTTQTKPPRKK